MPSTKSSLRKRLCEEFYKVTPNVDGGGYFVKNNNGVQLKIAYETI